MRNKDKPIPEEKMSEYLDLYLNYHESAIKKLKSYKPNQGKEYQLSFARDMLNSSLIFKQKSDRLWDRRK